MAAGVFPTTSPIEQLVMEHWDFAPGKSISYNLCLFCDCAGDWPPSNRYLKQNRVCVLGTLPRYTQRSHDCGKTEPSRSDKIGNDASMCGGLVISVSPVRINLPMRTAVMSRQTSIYPTNNSSFLLSFCHHRNLLPTNTCWHHINRPPIYLPVPSCEYVQNNKRLEGTQCCRVSLMCSECRQFDSLFARISF